MGRFEYTQEELRELLNDFIQQTALIHSLAPHVVDRLISMSDKYAQARGLPESYSLKQPTIIHATIKDIYGLLLEDIEGER
jgi:hypothetical protein